MTEEQQSYYDEGYAAYHAGKDEADCPYPTGYVEAPGEYWCDGWSDAEDEELQG